MSLCDLERRKVVNLDQLSPFGRKCGKEKRKEFDVITVGFSTLAFFYLFFYLASVPSQAFLPSLTRGRCQDGEGEGKGSEGSFHSLTRLDV